MLQCPIEAARRMAGPVFEVVSLEGSAVSPLVALNAGARGQLGRNELSEGQASCRGRLLHGVVLAPRQDSVADYLNPNTSGA